MVTQQNRKEKSSKFVHHWKIHNNYSMKNYEIMLTVATEKFQFSTHDIFHLINVAFVKPYKIVFLGN